MSLNFPEGEFDNVHASVERVIAMPCSSPTSVDNDEVTGLPPVDVVA